MLAKKGGNKMTIHTLQFSMRFRAIPAGVKHKGHIDPYTYSEDFDTLSEFFETIEYQEKKKGMHIVEESIDAYDKNNRLLYVGDIVIAKHYYRPLAIEKNHWGYCLKEDDDTLTMPYKETLLWIGNIHQNSDLLVKKFQNTSSSVLYSAETVVYPAVNKQEKRK